MYEVEGEQCGFSHETHVPDPPNSHGRVVHGYGFWALSLDSSHLDSSSNIPWKIMTWNLCDGI
jgi:hypothetical protein